MSKKKKISILAICSVIVIILAVSVPYAIKAILDPSEYTHVQDSDVEQGTLIIGSHLIHLKAINDELYLKAQDTASESGNTKVYYKSELAGGTWYEISSATSVADISTDGTPVNKSEIEQLNLRWHTKKDMITYDLLDGKAVSIFDTDDPYNLWKRKELEPLKNQYDNFTEQDPEEGSDLFTFNFLKSFYSYGKEAVHTDETNVCDAKINALQKFYVSQAEAEAPADELEFITKVQASVNAEREILIMKNIEPLIELVNNAVNGSSRVGYDDEEDALKLCDLEFSPYHEYTEENPAPDNVYTKLDMVLTAVTSSITNISDTESENESKIIGNGVTVLASNQSRKMLDLIDQANKNRFRDAETTTKTLVYLSNIENSLVVYKEEELDLLQKILVKESSERYEKKLKSGASSTYDSEKSNPQASTARLNKLLKDQVVGANAERGELEFFITAITERLDPSDASLYLQTLIDGVAALKNIPKTDDFKPVALQSIQEYKEWLEKKKSEIDALIDVSGQIDELLAEREKALDEKMQALDSNDLNAKKKAEAKISELDARIEALGGNPTAINEALNDALEALNSGNVTSLNEAIDTLNALYNTAPKAALEALLKLAEAVDVKIDAENAAMSSGPGTASPGAISGGGLATPGAISQGSPGSTSGGSPGSTSGGSPGSSTASSGAISSGGTENTLAKKLTGVLDNLVASITDKNTELEGGSVDIDDLLSLLSSLLGGDIGTLSADQQASAVLALNMLAEFTKDAVLKDYVNELSGMFYRQGNIYFYIQYKGLCEYIPANTLSKCIGYRYLFNNTQRRVVLSDRGDYYEFTAYYDTVNRPEVRDDDVTPGVIQEQMLTQAVFRDDVYIEETYCTEKLGWAAYYMVKGDKAICANTSIVSLAEELYEKMVTSLLPTA